MAAPKTPNRPLHRLWRSPHLHQNHPEIEARETWLELFYDLVYVAVLIQLGNVLSDDVSWAGAARFAVLFVPIWWAWSNFTFYMNRFVVDDVWHRLIVMLQIFCIAWIGSSVGGAFANESTQFVLLYIGLRVTIILLYARTFRSVPDTRQLVTRYITDYHLVAITLWGSSLFLDLDWRWTLWLAAFAWELGNAQRPLFRRFHQSFPLNGEHMRERFGTLILLVLGESFIKSITMDTSLPLTLEAFLFSAPGIAVLYSLWWLYFEDTDDAYEGKTANPALWIYTHLPLSLALIAFGVAVKKLFESVYAQPLNPDYAFMYCATLVIYCLALVVLNLWSDKVGRLERAYTRLGAAAILTLAYFIGERSLGAAANALFFVTVAFAVFALQVAHDLWLARRYPQMDDEVGELMA